LDSFRKDDKIRVQSFCLLYLIFLIIVLALSFKIIQLWRIHHLPEAGLAMIVGTVFSLMTYTVGYRDKANSFDGDFFFWFLLPPIIFQSGYTQDRNPFFSNWLTIVVFANCGTLISIVVFGYSIYWLGLLHLSLDLPIMECLAFGALISSTDPVSTLGVFAELKVHPALRAIIYGSSALDDAVAIVMFNAFQKYIGTETLGSDAIVAIILYLIVCVFASFIIGVLFGGAAAWCIKMTNIRGEKRLLICISVCLIYISYFACTVLELSGIISCMVSAISFKYCLDYGDVLTKTDFQALDLNFSAFAYFLETFTFFAMGMSIGSKFLEKRGDVDLRFVFWSLLFSTVSRGAYVYPLSFLCNIMNGNSTLGICNSDADNSDDNDVESSPADINSFDGEYDIYGKFKRSYVPHKLSMNKQHMIVFAGLRGPIAYGAAQLYPPDSPNFRNIYFATTAIVLVNIFVQGSLTKTALRVLKIDHTKNPDVAVAPLETNPCTDFTESRGGGTNNMISSRFTKATNSVNDMHDIEDLQSSGGLPKRDKKASSKPSALNNTTAVPNTVADRDLEAGEEGREMELSKEGESQDEDLNEESAAINLDEKRDDRPDRPRAKKARGDSRKGKILKTSIEKCVDCKRREDCEEQKSEGQKLAKSCLIMQGSTVSGLRESLRNSERSNECRTTKLFRKFEHYVVAPLFRSDTQSNSRTV
jgi:NhaP-type Na+/H+ or K+/H+ antiporter